MAAPLTQAVQTACKKYKGVLILAVDVGTCPGHAEYIALSVARFTTGQIFINANAELTKSISDRVDTSLFGSTAHQQNTLTAHNAALTAAADALLKPPFCAKNPELHFVASQLERYRRTAIPSRVQDMRSFTKKVFASLVSKGGVVIIDCFEMANYRPSKYRPSASDKIVVCSDAMNPQFKLALCGQYPSNLIVHNVTKRACACSDIEHSAIVHRTDETALAYLEGALKTAVEKLGEAYVVVNQLHSKDVDPQRYCVVVLEAVVVMLRHGLDIREFVVLREVTRTPLYSSIKMGLKLKGGLYADKAKEDLARILPRNILEELEAGNGKRPRSPDLVVDEQSSAPPGKRPMQYTHPPSAHTTVGETCPKCVCKVCGVPFGDCLSQGTHWRAKTAKEAKEITMAELLFPFLDKIRLAKKSDWLGMIAEAIKKNPELNTAYQWHKNLSRAEALKARALYIKKINVLP